MFFDEEFFRAEERSGYQVSSLMKRCWAAQMEVLDDFHAICRKHGLRYYLAYGTLLGAVRHEGFIPWDDDIDIWMPRRDLDCLIREAGEDIAAMGLELVTPFSDGSYNNLAFRLINSRPTCLDRDFLEKYWLFPFSAGLDLFPLDVIPEKEEDRELMKYLMYSANILGKEWSEKEQDAGKKEELKELYETLTDMLKVKRVEDDKVENQLWQLTDRISSLYVESDSEYVATTPYYFTNTRKLFRKEWFDTVVYKSFEGYELPCPGNYDQVLRAEFGDDYMTPRIEPGDHEYPYYKEYHRELLEWFSERGITCPEIYKSL